MIYQNIMIDLETLGTRQNAAFVSLGACAFDIDSQSIGDVFYCRIDFEDALKQREFDAATLKWWLKQSDAARHEITQPGKSLKDALTEFTAWITANSIFKDVNVWSNGSNFDIAILDHAYNYNPPWRYYNVRDVRTVVDLAQSAQKPVSKNDIPQPEIPHHALHDAIYQATYIMHMINALRSNA